MKNPSVPALKGQLNEWAGQVSHAQRVLWISVGILALTLGIGIFAIQIPWQESRKRIAKLQHENTERSQVLLSLQRSHNALKKTEQQFLLEGGSPVLTSQVTRLAAEAGVKIDSVAPRSESPLEPYVKFQVEVSATAESSQLLAFLQKIESHRPLLGVEELEIGQPTPGFRKPPAGEAPPEETPKVRLLIGSYGKGKPSR